MSSDVAIVGGGLIGLSIAFELATNGAAVRVYDTGDPGRAASWAGAGMLAPLTESIDDPAMGDLCRHSLAMYPTFIQGVRSAGGVDPHLRLEGILSVAYDDPSYDELARHHARLRGEHHDLALLDRSQTLALEPALSGTVVGSLFSRSEGQVDNRRLGRALLAACESAGVFVHSNLEFVRVECNERRVLGIVTEHGFTAAGNVVNAAGAWSAQIAGVPANCVPPVFPVKGQMLTIDVPCGFMKRVTWAHGIYLVPRSDGRLLVGATVEKEGFDTRVTSGGIQELLAAALRAAPSLGRFALTETWAGLRPGSPDGKPFIGATPLQNYFLATGHDRNGILLAPASASLIADAVSGRSNAFLDAFTPVRALTEGATA